eukprot:1160514-Pelagomonas_calceolata.AAC.3
MSQRSGCWWPRSPTQSTVHSGKREAPAQRIANSLKTAQNVAEVGLLVAPITYTVDNVSTCAVHSKQDAVGQAGGPVFAVWAAGGPF